MRVRHGRLDHETSLHNRECSRNDVFIYYLFYFMTILGFSKGGGLSTESPQVEMCRIRVINNKILECQRGLYTKGDTGSSKYIFD